MIKFFTDPHLGLVRRAHTTPESRLRLQQELFKAAFAAVNTDGPVLCLGDLFDTPDNSEDVILQGYEITSRCHAVLAGNHDSTNRESKLSSLQLLDTLLLARGYSTVYSARRGPATRLTFDGLNIVFVPHALSQSLFEQGLQEAEKLAQPTTGSKNILCLHCNYNVPHEMDDTSLNLTRDRTEVLLGRFDQILLGHEHIARADFGGRVQILGNLHPTSFSDISDKYTWELSEDGALIPTLVWHKNRGYRDIYFEDLGNILDLETVQFINIHGQAKPKDMPSIAKGIHELWAKCPNALMIRNYVLVEEDTLAASIGGMTKAVDVPTRISEEIKGTALEARWLDYLEKATC